MWALIVGEPAGPAEHPSKERISVVLKCTLWCPEHNLTCSPDRHWDALELEPFAQPPCIQRVTNWVQITNTLFESHVHYCFVTKWPKCSLKYVGWFLPRYLEQTDTKFNYSLNPGESLCADTVCWVSERSHNIGNRPIFITWHISIAYFAIIFGDFKFATPELTVPSFLLKIQWVNYILCPITCKKCKKIFSKNTQGYWSTKKLLVTFMC